MSVTPPEHLRPLDADEEAVVRALFRVVYLLPRAIDTDMVCDRQLPLTEYLALMHLSEAPGRQMRMSELAAACRLSLSGMTRTISRLEGQGLVRRVRSEEDARGWNAVLTDAGFARLEESWPSHLASVRRRFLDHFEGIDLARLARALERVGTSADRGEPPGCPS
ncbi:MarR family winged helix-turn-helix transcriptional regulator [Micromonospora globbae]|jgi:DNA-binding MarR family transcriptional regulator|uniref:MarR family transcriptional regulator n=1 Tax=Micromonospora globbae TaxID=1894969 RepID=A0A420F7X5_9ACTN|nr:MarR family winged helix-turn-helix transcriptional regulator [Micromonospora globbae]RKF29027.1 MarR family transcriptional regulator [Micromonospora globbae]WTF84068.1 MarR family winged helix-turn-helix transcriptional regulator [Micromonospora globbae]